MPFTKGQPGGPGRPGKKHEPLHLYREEVRDRLGEGDWEAFQYVYGIRARYLVTDVEEFQRRTGNG